MAHPSTLVGTGKAPPIPKVSLYRPDRSHIHIPAGFEFHHALFSAEMSSRQTLRLLLSSAEENHYKPRKSTSMVLPLQQKQAKLFPTRERLESRGSMHTGCDGRDVFKQP